MAWQPPSDSAPNFDTGFVSGLLSSFADAPNVADQTLPLWLLGVWVRNNTASEQTLDLRDHAGITVATFYVPSGFSGPLAQVPFMPMIGLQWKASDATGNFVVKVWGRQ